MPTLMAARDALVRSVLCHLSNRKLIGAATTFLFVFSPLLSALTPPEGFKQAPIRPQLNTRTECPETPTPFTDVLVFTSKYEGMDDASSIVNPDALDTYKEQTNPMTELQRMVADQSNKYLRTGNLGYRDCAISMMLAWAQVNALVSDDANHTGAAVRKWTLAAISAAYAKLLFSAADNPALSASERRPIEQWLTRLAEKVIEDYQHNPLAKVNNHDYWAAWAVGITAVSLGRDDFLQWSYSKFIQAMGQVDKKTGFLPNEIRRKSLALSYHHYAIQPLVSLAVLLKANGYEVMAENHHALERLVNATLAASERRDIIEQLAGVPQNTTKLLSSTGLSWLEPWLLLKPDADIKIKWQQLRPMTSSRLGGDLTLLYTERYIEKNESDLSHPMPPLSSALFVKSWGSAHINF